MWLCFLSGRRVGGVDGVGEWDREVLLAFAMQDMSHFR